MNAQTGIFGLLATWVGLALWQTLFDQLTWALTPLLLLNGVLDKTNLVWRYLGKLTAMMSSCFELLPLEAFCKNFVTIAHTLLQICFAAKEFAYGYLDMICQMEWSLNKIVAGSIVMVLVSCYLIFQFVLPPAWKKTLQDFFRSHPPPANRYRTL
jgi:hypothetical protein